MSVVIGGVRIQSYCIIIIVTNVLGVANETPLAFFTLAEIYLLERKDEFIANRKFQHSGIVVIIVIIINK